MAGANGPDLIWFGTLVVLTVAMTVGSVWVMRVWNDVKGGAKESSDDPVELLEPLAEAFAAGQMSEEEYQRIKQSVGRSGRLSEPPPRPRPSRATPEPPTDSGLPDAPA